MAILKIATIGHPILRQLAREVTREELASAEMQRFIDDLIETMRDANGAGLAANQVHNPVRIAAIEINKNPRYPYKPDYPLTVLVNPLITPIYEKTESLDSRFMNYEGCLSVPNLRGEVERWLHVRVRAWDRLGNALDFDVKGITSGTFQHEVDHLDGKMFIDRVQDTSTLTTWADFERFHMAKFVERAKGIVAKYGS